MALDREKLPDGCGGEVSVLITRPPAARALVVLAHGAGNDMSSPLLSAVHEGLAAREWAVARFNFPYKERDGRVPDPAPVLESCYQSVLEALRREPALGRLPLFIGGKSLGARIASHLAAQGAELAGLVFLGYPLHPPGKPEKLRTAHLPRITAPMLFLAGTRDPLCRLDLLRRAIGTLHAPATLHVIEDGDHSFAVRRRTGRSPAQVLEEIVGVTAAWLDERAPR